MEGLVDAGFGCSMDAISNSTSPRPEFVATQQWWVIIGAFCKDIPLKRVRYYLKVYSNCFTGAQAVNWLKKYFRESGTFGPVTTSQVEKFCQKLIDRGVIYDPTKGSCSSEPSSKPTKFNNGLVPYSLVHGLKESKTSRSATISHAVSTGALPQYRCVSEDHGSVSRVQRHGSAGASCSARRPFHGVSRSEGSWNRRSCSSNFSIQRHSSVGAMPSHSVSRSSDSEAPSRRVARSSSSTPASRFSLGAAPARSVQNPYNREVPYDRDRSATSPASAMQHTRNAQSPTCSTSSGERRLNSANMLSDGLSYKLSVQNPSPPDGSTDNRARSASSPASTLITIRTASSSSSAQCSYVPAVTEPASCSRRTHRVPAHRHSVGASPLRSIQPPANLPIESSFTALSRQDSVFVSSLNTFQPDMSKSTASLSDSCNFRLLHATASAPPSAPLPSTLANHVGNADNPDIDNPDSCYGSRRHTSRASPPPRRSMSVRSHESGVPTRISCTTVDLTRKCHTPLVDQARSLCESPFIRGRGSSRSTSSKDHDSVRGANIHSGYTTSTSASSENIHQVPLVPQHGRTLVPSRSLPLSLNCSTAYSSDSNRTTPTDDSSLVSVDADAWKEAVLSRLLGIIDIPAVEAIIHCVDIDGRNVAANCGHPLDTGRNMATYKQGRARSRSGAGDSQLAMFGCEWSDVHALCPRSSPGASISYTPLICSAMDYLACYPCQPTRTCCEFWTEHGVQDIVPIIAQHFRRVVDKPVVPCSCYPLFAATYELLRRGKHQKAIGALQLCVLLLPKDRLVLLKRIMLFFAECERNDFLKLWPAVSNMRNLCFCIGPAVLQQNTNADWPPEEDVEIMSFLAMNARQIFKVPEWLSGQFVQPVAPPRPSQTLPHSAQDSIDSAYGSDAHTASSPTKNHSALPDLLDTIIAGEGMTKRERAKRLKKFQAIHPLTYASRLPSGDSKHGWQTLSKKLSSIKRSALRMSKGSA